MKLYKTLEVTLAKKKYNIHFGMAETEDEKQKVFSLRYKVYNDRKYLTHNSEDGLEFDELDSLDTTKHFMVVLGDKLIGTIRYLQTNPFPTEKYFKFETPTQLSEVSKDKLVELGRFIIIPPDKERKVFLPRNIVLLFMIDTLLNYGRDHDVVGGYSFVKLKLLKKLQKLNAPMHLIEKAELRYPEDGNMYPYFHQMDDPAYPTYFLVQEFIEYTSKLLKNTWLFKTDNGDENKLILKSGFYRRVLDSLNII